MRQQATGFIETLRTYAGRPALLQAHLARLSEALPELDIASLGHQIERTLDDRPGEWMIRVEASPSGAEVELRPLPDHALEDPARPISALVCDAPGYSYPRKYASRELHEALLARAEQAGAEEALIADAGELIEGTRTSVFLLTGDQLVTPPLGRPLPGITRAAVIELASSLGLSVCERAVRVEEWRSADELLLTNSLIGLRRVDRVDGEPLGGKAPDLTERIRSALLAHYERAL